MDAPPGSHVAAGSVGIYVKAIRWLRSITNSTVNKEPKWRRPGKTLTTGYHAQA